MGVLKKNAWYLDINYKNLYKFFNLSLNIYYILFCFKNYGRLYGCFDINLIVQLLKNSNNNVNDNEIF